MGAGASTPRGEPPPRIPASALAGTWKACSKHKWQLDEEHYGKSAAAIAESFDQIVRVGTSDGVHRWSYGSVCSGTTTFTSATASAGSTTAPDVPATIAATSTACMCLLE